MRTQLLFIIPALAVAASFPAMAAKPRRQTAAVVHHAAAGSHHSAAGRATAHRGRATTSSRAHAAHASSHPVVAMDSQRATQIQAALIRNGYLSGEPSGHWDAESIAAMQKLQADNGWQTKIMPDSRAIIKLGLGPGSEPPAPATAAPEPPPHLF